MKLLQFSLLFAVISLLTGCGGGGGGGTTSATVIGRAVQTTTLLPVPDASVTITGGGTSKTDSTGSFTVSAATGLRQLTVKKTGYQDAVVDVDVQSGNNVLPDPVRLVVLSSGDPPAPSGPGTIGGTVTLSGQTDASGAVVKLFEGDILYESKTTPSSGEYLIWAPIGTYTLRVEKTGFVTLEQQVKVTDLSVVKTVNVTLQRT